MTDPKVISNYGRQYCDVCDEQPPTLIHVNGSGQDYSTYCRECLLKMVAMLTLEPRPKVADEKWQDVNRAPQCYLERQHYPKV